MPRYFFHVGGRGASLIDEQGVPLPDAEAAWYQAVRSARELVRADLQLGCSWEGRSVEIADERGLLLARVPLHEVASYAL